MTPEPANFWRRQYEGLSGRGVVCFLVLNLFVRLWVFFRSGTEWSGTTQTDERSYLNIAAEFLSQGPAWLLGERALQAAPGHVALLTLAGGSVAIVKAVSMTCSTLTLLPVLAIARRVLPPRGAFWAAVAFTACLIIDSYAMTILTESINSFLLTTSIALFFSAHAKSSLRWAFVAGLCLGLATLWRATTLFFPIGVALLILSAWVVPPLRRRLGFEVSASLKVTAVLGLGLATITAPVMIKNGVSTGQWKLATGQGATTYLGADPKTNGWEPYFAGYDFDTFQVSKPYSHIEPEGDRRLTKAAMRQIRRDPLGFMALRIHWPIRLFVGEPSDAFNPASSAPQSWRMVKKNATLLAIWNLAWRALAITFAGWFLARHWRRFEGFVLLSMLIYFFLLFLTMFAIVRFTVPLLPLLVVPMVGGMLEATRSRWIPGVTAALLVTAISFWNVVFPKRVDPSQYVNHTELARWTDAKSPWKPLHGLAAQQAAPEHQRFIVLSDGATLQADGQSIPLEHNQLFLIPMAVRVRPAGWPLHAYWRSANHPNFSEDRTADAYALSGSAKVDFHLDALPSDKLEAFRIDLNLPENAKLQVAPAQIEGRPSASEPWTNHFGCTAMLAEDAGVACVGGPGPEAVETRLSAPMDAPLTISVPVGLPDPMRSSRETRPEALVVMRWQLEGETAYQPANRREFGVPRDGQVHWTHLNPSLFPSGSTWEGKLKKIALVFPDAPDFDVEIGAVRLVKDYRMVGP